MGTTEGYRKVLQRLTQLNKIVPSFACWLLLIPLQADGKNCQSDNLKLQISCLTKEVARLGDESQTAEVKRLNEEVQKLKDQIGPALKWPHAINCGNSWNAFYVLHGSPLDNGNVPLKDTDVAQYDQVYQGEHRFVRFNADGSFKDRGGHHESSTGCENRSIELLRKQGQTFQFIQK